LNNSCVFSRLEMINHACVAQRKKLYQLLILQNAQCTEKCAP
jgi:hypothetical protein